MRNAIGAPLLLLLALVSQPALAGGGGIRTGWSEDIVGELKLDQPATALSPDGSSLELASESALVSFRAGVIGLRYPRLLIRVARGTAELRVPRQAFKSRNRVAAAAAELRQAFGIEGTRGERVDRAWDSEGVEDCQYECGSSPMVIGDVITFTTDYCPGTQRVKRANSSVRKTFTLRLIRADGAGDLGRFESIGAPELKSLVLSATPCARK